MNFVKVNYHLNQNYYVEDVAFLQIVTKSLYSIQDIKLISAKVKLDESSNAFNLFLEVKKNKKISYKDASYKIKNDIEEYSYLLLASKPKNIQIIFRESYTKLVKK